MRRMLPLLVTALLLGACQEEVAEEMIPPADSIQAEMQGVPAADTATTGALVDPATATEQELANLGLDEATVAALLAGRPYENMVQVDGILAGTMDEAAREALYARMFMPLDLNNATGEEIQLIPGVGDRMEHEFEEYRPYTDIAQFQREMGKYVDDEEVARLSRYVRITGS